MMSMVIDKHGFMGKLNNSGPVLLELGCGSRKRNAGALGIDALDYPAVDIVGDVFDVLRRFPSGSVDQVYSCHFIEHVEDLHGLMAELSRVLKPDGLVEFIAPHFSNPYFYSDPTHRRFFGLYTFCYFSAGALFRRTVPVYQKELSFRLESVDLLFKSARPFYVRYALKSLIGKIFNSCNYMKELYEENFCYLFPCYEIRYRLRRVETMTART
jgi:SAM-dependent methyltransferase